MTVHAMPDETPPIPVVPLPSRLPLFLLLDITAPQSWVDACERAADQWGVRFAIFGGLLDRPFSANDGITAVHVRPTLPRINGSDIYGRMDMVYGKRGEPIATIMLSDETPEDKRVRTCAHEIGHALGLAHSEDRASIMYQYALGTPYSIPRDLTGLPRLFEW